MLARPRHKARLEALLAQFPVVGLIGARQVGKTTLARDLASNGHGRASFLDLENPLDVGQLANPMLALGELRGLVVLDEIQRIPELFPVLRVLADRPGTPARFLVLGSASPDLIRRSSESLAGRIAYHELGGLALDEVGAENMERLWLRGGFPRSYLAPSDEASAEWRRGFVRTFVERDLAVLGVRIAPETMQRFWSMLAHYHGQMWNASELARAFGVTEKTVRHYLDILCATFVARRLVPWFENVGKRLVKAPKVYLTDSGLLHTLLGVETRAQLLGHPKVGASFEGFAIREVIERIGARAEECFFWGTHNGAELDLLVVRGQKRRGYEVKFTQTPKVTPSMRSAIEALKLERVDVVHAGRETFPLAENVRAVAAARIGVDVGMLT